MKTGSIPCKADPVVQKEFLETTMEPVICEAKRGEVDLYYVDAAMPERANDDMVNVRRAIATWIDDRNNHANGVVWQFTSDNARQKPKTIYPIYQFENELQ